MEEKLNLKYPVIVEGKYDKAKLSLVVASPIITLEGFSIFKNEDKKALLKRLSNEKGIILLADSDRAGNFLRSKLKGIIKGTIYNVYTPAIAGKERRKAQASADGLLGVEGIGTSVLRDLLVPFTDENIRKQSQITKTRFYEDGFSGAANSSERRERLAELLSFPKTLTAKALLDAINLLCTEDEYISAVLRINNGE
jgi:ribonuclease M5